METNVKKNNIYIFLILMISNFVYANRYLDESGSDIYEYSGDSHGSNLIAIVGTFIYYTWGYAAFFKERLSNKCLITSVLLSLVTTVLFVKYLFDYQGGGVIAIVPIIVPFILNMVRAYIPSKYLL
ncbi:hypothetical protein T644_18725 [Klebsiella pneumoniae MRSN 2404]|nr:hypothetical protein T644_18725 [Klebsiella pneumoniae MRSN 2404]OVK29497.1 hypothetical protein B8058_22520 [Klebsiella pneumoniae]HBX3232907.1 hypothetical protein [Klebsiella pneumoniae]HBY0124510.1 hypothetical protein [Klebsiella pneumoniae]HBY1772452.1 hypothetical protein [Klebsiella pneumoniae]